VKSCFSKKKRLFKKRIKKENFKNKTYILSVQLIDRIHNIENNRNVEIFDTIDELFTEFGILNYE